MSYNLISQALLAQHVESNILTGNADYSHVTLRIPVSAHSPELEGKAFKVAAKNYGITSAQYVTDRHGLTLRVIFDLGKVKVNENDFSEFVEALAKDLQKVARSETIANGTNLRSGLSDSTAPVHVR